MRTIFKVGGLCISTAKIKRSISRIKRPLFVFFLICSLFFQQVGMIFAATSPWSQTDWSGGSGQTSWSDATKYDSSSTVNTSTAGQITLQATGSWYNASWAYRKKITFNNSAQAENLTNFPVLVKLSSSNFDFTKAQSAGQDIRFTDSDGITALSYEIEQYSNSSSTANIWVKVPQIDASSATDNIYIYYGNSSATDGQAATSVWNSNYAGVWHLPNGTTLTANDSTSNTNTGTINGATAATGQIDGAASFSGTGQYINVSNSVLGSIGPTSTFTLSAWVKPHTTQQAASGDRRAAIGFANSQNDFEALIGLPYSSVNKLSLEVGKSYVTSQNVVATSTYTVDTWYKLVGVFKSGSADLYVNGTLQGSVTYNATINGSSAHSNNWAIGSEPDLSASNYPYLWNGQIDEVRISNISRSVAWISAEYKTENDTFNTFASEEPTSYVSSGALTSSIFDTEQGSNWGTLTYSATIPSNTSVSVKARTSNSSSMSGATAFSSCSAITSGSDISSNSCVTDTHRYIQYQLSLANTDSVSTPTFQDISIVFTASDATAPSISLTALSPDPNSDTTPTLSGTATDSNGTVSNVQFQMDATSGSWSSCTADDGTLDETSETFTCTPSALSDGSHTMYVRATDSNGNTTGSGSESSDAFTIDATVPTSIDLDSPGNNSYTNSERPSFKWKATTDATAGLSKYVLEIDNPSAGSGQASGDFTIDDIPTSRTTDLETNKYVIHYDNFNDSDSTNNYISVWTKSSSDWGSDTNDGKLREGRISWKVKARDNAGNEATSSRTLFVDRTNPSVEFTQINDSQFSASSKSNFSTTDNTPTIFGKVVDALGGVSDNQNQSEDGPKVASGPKQVEVKIEKKEGLTYKLHTLSTINMNTPWYTCTNLEVPDNSKQKCDKYLPFEFTSENILDFGTYLVTITGKDKADNSSSSTSFTLTIGSLSQVVTPEEEEIIDKVIEEELPEATKQEKERAKEELEITKPLEPKEPSVLDKAGEGIANASRSVLEATGTFISGVASGIGHRITMAASTIWSAVAFTGQKIGEGIVYDFTIKKNNIIATGYLISNISGSIAQVIGNTYNYLAQNAPGILGDAMEAFGNGVRATTNVIASGSEAISDQYEIATSSVRNGFLAMTDGVKNGIANAAFFVGEHTQNASESVGFAFVKFGYLFVNEPTRIADVKVIKATPTSATISWTTNHPANGKVNYGLTADYGKDEQSEKRITYHKFTITNLKPDTVYYYEVMSHNKNYVYDANHTFTTPKQGK